MTGVDGIGPANHNNPPPPEPTVHILVSRIGEAPPCSRQRRRRPGCRSAEARLPRLLQTALPLRGPPAQVEMVLEFGPDRDDSE